MVSFHRPGKQGALPCSSRGRQEFLFRRNQSTFVFLHLPNRGPAARSKGFIRTCVTLHLDGFSSVS